MPRLSWKNRITTRVVLLSAAVALLLGTTLLVLIYAVNGQRHASRQAYRSQEALTAGSQLEKSLISIENGLRGYVASGRKRFLVPANAAIRDHAAELRRFQDLVSDEPGQRAEVARIGGLIDDYVTLWARPLIALAAERRAAAQSAVVTQGGRQRLEDIRSHFAVLFARERTVTRQREQRAENRSDLAVGIGIGGLALVLAIVAAVAMHLRRTVVKPVVALAEATGELAQGDLTTRVPVVRGDEIGDLAKAFNAMADSLQTSEAQLSARTLELERSNAELEQFASVTSHDLQAPLATISMYATLLDRRAGDGGGGELVAGIRSATQQARELIGELLDYSRAGRGAPELEHVPVDELLEQALDVLAGPIADARARVTVARMPVVLADRRNLSRVFQNLIGNAVKFSDRDAPEVSVDAQRDGELWHFSVRDNGIGMDPAHAERIFQPFQRLHGEDRFPGTGLGLAVCERIVEQHGGRIWVRSRPGEGSVFFFTLPASGALPRPDVAGAPVGASV